MSRAKLPDGTCEAVRKRRTGVVSCNELLGGTCIGLLALGASSFNIFYSTLEQEVGSLGAAVAIQLGPEVAIEGISSPKLESARVRKELRALRCDARPLCGRRYAALIKAKKPVNVVDVEAKKKVKPERFIIVGCRRFDKSSSDESRLRFFVEESDDFVEAAHR